MAEAVQKQEEEVPVEPSAPAPPEEGRRETISRVWEQLAEAPEEKPAEEQRARDEHGRFLPKEEPKVEAKPPEGRPRQKAQAELETPEPPKGKTTPPTQTPQETAPAPGQGFQAAPAFLRPATKDLWAKLGPEFNDLKEDFHKRDMEAVQTLERTKSDRQILQRIGEAVAPYQAMIAAEGGNIITGLQSYYQAATLMRTGSPQAKANWLAEATINFLGKDYLQLLDEALSSKLNGQAPPQAQNGAPPPYQQPVDIEAKVNAALDARMYKQDLETEKQSFAQWQDAEEREWLPYVQADMADLMDLAYKRNRYLSYDDAYAMAINANPEIAKALRQREAAAAAQAQAAGRSRRAAVSIKTSPASPMPLVREGMTDAESRRVDLLEAWDKHMGG